MRRQAGGDAAAAGCASARRDAPARRGIALLVAGADALHHLPDAADLLAPQHEFKTDQRDPRRASRSGRRTSRSRNYRVIFTDPVWYNGYINSIIYVVMNTVISVTRGAAGGLCLLALPLPRRQASVLLAADQPHGAAGRVRAAVLPALFGVRPVRHAHRRGAGALPVQRAAGGVDPRRLHVRRAEGDRRDRLYRRLFLPALLREDLHAADRVAASASPPSSASCSPGSNCCSPAR